MNAAHIINLVQQMNAAGFKLMPKDYTFQVLYIIRNGEQVGECASLEEVEGWFKCWLQCCCTWVPAGASDEPKRD